VRRRKKRKQRYQKRIVKGELSALTIARKKKVVLVDLVVGRQHVGQRSRKQRFRVARRLEW